MDAMTEDTRLPADLDAQPLVQAAAGLRPVLRGRQEEIEREQRLPATSSLRREDAQEDARDPSCRGHLRGPLGLDP